MKKIFLPIAVLLIFVLAACGGETDLEGIVDTAQEGLETAQETVQDVVDEVSETETTEEEGNLLTVEDVLGSYTFHDPTNDWHYAEITPDGDILKWTNQAGIEWSLTPDFANNRLLTDDSFPYQAQFQNFDLVIEDGEYTGFVSNNDFWAHDASGSVLEPNDTEDPAGTTFDVDTTQPVGVKGDNGTQVSAPANEIVDENGNPPAGDVQVNMFTPEAEELAACDAPDTTETLTVWSYNEETGLWEEGEPVAYNPATGWYDLPVDEAAQTCDESIASVSVDVTDDAGNEYDLADGTQAEVSVPCEPRPDQVLTVWSYDETTGLWVEDGPVTIEDETCSAEVSNLSNVNFVAKEPVSGIQGQVVDVDSGEALVGAQVCVQGSEQCATVGSDGRYVLSNLDPAELVFEVTTEDYITAVQTITVASGETLNQDFALTVEIPILAVLPSDIVLRGAIANMVDNVLEETIVVGNTFEFSQINAGISVPNYGITQGDLILYVGLGSYVEVVVPNRSETELGKAANTQLESRIFQVVTIGDNNQPLMLDDQMEVVLPDPSSSNPPYIVNFYRGEGDARTLVATFTINNQ